MPAQAPGVVTSPTSTTEAAPQLSAAAGAVKAGVAGHSIVASAPWPESVGGVVSTTVMVWLLVADSLPQASTAFQVLVRL